MKYWDRMWNPVIGCTPCSPACDRCYAESGARRIQAAAWADCRTTPWAEVVGPDGWTGKVIVDLAKLQCLPIPSGRVIFVCGMSDLFHEKAPAQTIEHVAEAAMSYPDKEFLLLTQRPARMLEGYHCLWLHGLAMSNLWWGVTAWDQASLDDALLHLTQIEGKRWLSLEPLLGPIDLSGGSLRTIDQIIVGGETGWGARPAELDWFRTIRDACCAAYFPFFLKQISGKRGDRRLDGREHNDLAWRPRP